MSLQCGGAKALGTAGLGGGGGAGRLPEGSVEGIPALEGSAERVPESCWKGFQHWKGPLEGSAGRGFSDGRGVPTGFQPGVPGQ